MNDSEPDPATSNRPAARPEAAPRRQHRAVTEEAVGGYRHEALLYRGTAEFLTRATSFIRRAVDAGDPILVVVSRAKIGMLRQELGAEAARVSFADMGRVGGNPGRIIAVWRDFVQDHAGASQLYGIGEPVDPGRSPAELAECHLHEALLNVAFDASTPFWLLCPYDLEVLAADVIGEAHRTHPFVARGEDRKAHGSFRPVNLADPFARPLPPRPAETAYMAIQPGTLGKVRTFVAALAQRTGLDQRSVTAIVQAVNEIATNSLRHGGGQGELHTWTDNQSLVCEVSDHGHITSPLAGRLPPTPDTTHSAGLWLANQLCDLVQIYSSPGRTAIRLHQNF
jgi:anti-sigma regulatory factor (Ser/Thr protein kinase)